MRSRDLNRCAPSMVAILRVEVPPSVDHDAHSRSKWAFEWVPLDAVTAVVMVAFPRERLHDHFLESRGVNVLINSRDRRSSFLRVAASFKHLVKPGRVTVPGKPSDDLAPGTLNSILKQSGLKK